MCDRSVQYPVIKSDGQVAEQPQMMTFAMTLFLVNCR
jgi:hypothetical protein